LDQAVTTRRWNLIKPVLRILCILVAVYGLLVLLVYFRQRSLIFFPTHLSDAGNLAVWSENGRVLGCCREVPNPHTIWLMMHGNGGQAAHRDYILSCMDAQDSLFVLEYPGYGIRPGVPSLKSINEAAVEAYQILRSRNPGVPVCIISESIGSGPACMLAKEKIPPDKIVLIVPFDSLANVASEHFWFLPVRFLLQDRWDNVEAMRHYTGPVEIYAATNDTIIPKKHAESLAKQIGARFVVIGGGHNDWSEQSEVKIRR
jgi:uncharacterized protein